MTENNFYPVFVADQVLTDGHLNELVSYLDEQQRLTRNKLIGIGIVCGLELTTSATEIRISKGCGVTSEGYLITQEDAGYTHYKPYSLPADFMKEDEYKDYETRYKKWHSWELLPAAEDEETEDALVLNSVNNFLQDKIVVLFLEMKNTQLKNCTGNDCDDKGMKIEFNLKPLLVLKADIDKYIASVKDKELSIGPAIEKTKGFRSIALKRLNVPFQSLADSDAVINAFLDIVDTNTLKTLSDNLNACYTLYKPLLPEYATNPFSTAFTTLSTQLNTIKSMNPAFIQYYYDWIDDIVKAYLEFRDKALNVQTQCCPDENLFPLHLMLGRATENTVPEIKMSYREYFIYSQLFNNQKDLLIELQLLFRRMVLLVKNFEMKKASALANTRVKITPSKYLDKPLSERCIPYYYNTEGLYQCWSWFRTKRGNAAFNLSYNAEKYSTSDIVINPLLYDIEQYNFFRIEGHIGKTFSSALSSIETERKNKNLPFHIIGLSTATIAKFSSADDYNCLFKDLESAYAVLCAELDGSLKEVVNIASSYKYDQGVFVGIDLVNVISALPGFFSKVSSGFKTNTSLLTKNKSLKAANKASGSNFLFATSSNKESVTYDTADYLDKTTGSIGEIYFPGIITEILIGLDLANHTSVTSYLTKFISAVENVLVQALNLTLGDFDNTKFTSAFKALIRQANTWIAKTDTEKELEDGITALQAQDASFKFERFIQLVNEIPYSYLDDKFTALKAEYDQRLQEINTLRTLKSYAEKHPGMEHKAGVPKGGTFILIYHETTESKQTFTVDKTTVDSLTNLGLLAVKPTLTASPGVSANIPFVVAAEKPGGLFEIETTKVSTLNTNFLSGLNFTANAGNSIIKRDVIKSQFKFPEQTVIADFYLPYICCSDCPPMQFVVLPEPPADIVTIEIAADTYCNTDTKTYAVTVSPEGGTLTASSGGIVAGKFEFAPLNIPEGINTLTYTLPDGSSASLDVQVVSSDASFTLNITQDANSSVQIVTLNAKDTDATEYTWSIRQGRTVLTFNTKDVELNYKEMGLTGGSDLNIELMVNTKLNTSDCTDSEKYTLTEAIFFKHLNNGEFDNTTTE